MQKFFTRKRSLARKAAAMMSAVMLFTSEAGVFLESAAVVNAADDEAQEDAAEESGTVSAADGAFSVTVSKLQYGEDGSNAKGNLDAIFAPKLMADGAELVLGKDYTTSYKFFADKEEALAVTADSFADAEGLVLSEVPAGTTVYAVVKAVAADADYLVSAELTVAKRTISLSYEASADAAIEGRDVAEDGSYVIAADDVDYSGFTLDIADGFAYELNAEALLSGDVVLDLSGVDLSADSCSSVPMEVWLDPAFEDNYELDKNIHGDYYILKAQYYVVFTANNNGEVFTKTYAFPSYDFSGTAQELLDKLGATADIFTGTGSEYTLGGFLDTATDHLTGWTVYTDGFNAKSDNYQSGYYNTTVNVNADASTYDDAGNKKDFKLSGKKDYLFVGQISKAAADNLFVSVIPSVYYDTREHVALGSKANAKKQAADLRIKVNYSDNGKVGGMQSYSELNLNTDYTVKYFNNKDASMAVSENGTYVRIKSDDQRPRVEITGKGNYTGFSATVYFDILPINMGDYEYKYDFIHEKNDTYRDGFDYSSLDNPYTYVHSEAAKVSGISKDTYILKNGKVSGINPKLTKYYYTYGYGNYKTAYNTITLKAGTDYTQEIWKWNSEDNCWDKVEGITDPNKITEAGDYLLLFRGTGNYCGAIFGGYDANHFASGRDTEGYINPSHDPGTDFQFRITDTTNFDVEYATVTIGTKSVKWDGLERNSASFNIVVKDKSKKELEYGKDYLINFSARYSNANGKNGGESITASNVYTLYLIGVGDYYGYKYGKTVTIQGLKLNKKFFTINGSSWDVSEAGKTAGLVKDQSSNAYYVSSYTSSSNGKKNLVIGGSGRSGQAIDPASTVKSPIKVTKMQLKDAIANGYVSFTVSDNGAYNIKGAIPDSIQYRSGKYQSNNWGISSLYSGFRAYISIYDPETNNYMGYAYVTFTFKNNTKLGKTAKVTASVTGGNMLTGSAELGTYKVVNKDVFNIPVYSNVTPYAGSMSYSAVYSVVMDAPQSKGKLDKPNVKLYQVYRDKNGSYKSVALSAKQYTIKTGDELGSNHIAINTYAANGKTGDFNFIPEYSDLGVFTGVFALYKAKLTPADISAVSINGIGYTVNKGVIDSSFAPEFTGYYINPQVDKVTASKAELVNSSDYDLGYYTNTAAGDKSGTIMIMPHYNSKTDSYEYGGTALINFKIASVEGVTL